MAYRDQSWNQRFATMGDTAEAVFEEIAPLGSFERYGWNRPAVPMTKMSAMVKATPDYYCGTGHLVEVKGLGRDGILKLKVDTYKALQKWNKVQPVMLFAWNSATEEWALLNWDQIVKLVAKARKKGIESFQNDGNEYYPISWEWVEVVMPYA